MPRTAGNASPAYRDRNSTADRALDILTMFDDTGLVFSGTAVAERPGAARSTAYRYLQSLVATSPTASPSSRADPPTDAHGRPRGPREPRGLAESGGSHRHLAVTGWNWLA
ncbi:helix-turn-helix domain-containing protein [Streptomyces phaeolivaceus]|uniref:helix-turn-helix domain-containing protein n=1 Tax=Streptomyces phaeolivaceus TaxID=2653200 RepID=UPI001D05BF00|nr:helix-turn-helix domain-containing protein [Streptomyces phaeolivaceus]